MNHVTNQQQEACGVAAEDATHLLQYYKWDRERLMEGMCLYWAVEKRE